MRIKSKHIEVWSIGTYKMVWDNDRLSFSTPRKIKNPILTAKDITDRKAEFVADPFLVYENGTYYMFFEVCANSKENIGLAISNDGRKWEYQGIVLDEPFNVAYPCVFCFNGKYYMTPETYKTNSIRVYEAVEFPFKWKFIRTIAEGRDFADPTPFQYTDKWWLFASNAECSHLYLYYSDNLEGPWSEHPKSPIINNDRTKARPAGNVICLNDKIIRLTQNDYPYYGKSVRAFNILKLNQEEYEEVELENSPWLKPSGKRWNMDGMHHLSTYKVDKGCFLACVDGKIHRKKYFLDIRLPYLFILAFSKITLLKTKIIKNINLLRNV